MAEIIFLHPLLIAGYEEENSVREVIEKINRANSFLFDKAWEERSGEYFGYKLSNPYLEKPSIKYSLALLAGALKDLGYSILYFPLNLYCYKLGFSEGLKKLRNYIEDAKITGVSVYTPDVNSNIKVLEIVKKWNPNVKTVVGGPHATFKDLEVIGKDSVDFVVRGEGEETMKELVEAIFKDREDLLEGIRGITYKTKDGRIKRNPERPISKDLDKYPLPDFSCIPQDSIKDLVAYTIVSRGCPYRCKFCATQKLWGEKIRFRSPEKVAEEIEKIRKAFGQNVVYLGGSFLVSKNYSSKLAEELKKLDEINFFADFRPGELDEEIIRRLMSSGFIKLSVEIQSGSPKILKLMGVKFRPDIIKPQLEKLKKAGVPFVNGYWMFGYPGETYDTGIKSLEALNYLLRKRLLFDANISIFTPLPGIEIYEHPEKYGVKILTKSYDEFNGSKAIIRHTLMEGEIEALYLCAQILRLENLCRYLGINYKEILNFINFRKAPIN